MPDTEKDQIEKLRSLVKDLSTDLTDFDLLRWLQASEFDIDATLPKLRKHLRFLNSWDVKNYQRDPIVHKFWPFGLLGTTGKDNNLLFIETTGLIDGEGFVGSVPKTHFYRTRTYDTEIVLEAIREQERKTGKQCKLTMIFDFEHMEYSKQIVAMASGRHKAFSQFFFEHYPEISGKLIAINTPSFMSYTLQALTPFFPERITSKCVVLGPDWKNEILQYVDASALPVYWGGTLLDENKDSMCRTKIVVPPSKIPIECYWTSERAEFADDELDTLEVVCGQYDYISTKAEIGDKLKWYFLTDNGFAFGVYFTKDENETDSDAMEMIFPNMGLFPFAANMPENEEMICKQRGYYKLKFDNSHAWWATLTVRYKINLVSK